MNLRCTGASISEKKVAQEGLEPGGRPNATGGSGGIGDMINVLSRGGITFFIASCFALGLTACIGDSTQSFVPEPIAPESEALEDQKDQLVTLRQQVGLAMQKNDTRGAKDIAKRAVKLAQDIFANSADRTELARDLRTLATLQLVSGEGEEARLSVEAALGAAQRSSGHHEILIAELTRELSGFTTSPFKANELSTQALALARRYLPRNSSQLLPYLQVQAATLCNIGHAAEARAPLQEAMKLIEQSRLNPLNKVNCHLGLVQVELSEKNWQAARQQAQAAIALAEVEREKMPHVYWTAIEGLSVVYQVQKQYRQAEELLEPVVKSKEWKELSLTQKKELLSQLSLCIRKQGRSKEASALLNKFNPSPI